MPKASWGLSTRTAIQWDQMLTSTNLSAAYRHIFGTQKRGKRKVKSTTAGRWLVGKNVKLVFISDPKEYELRIDKALEMPLGLEYVVTVASGGTEYEACIPASNFVTPFADGDPKGVYGKFVGFRGDERVVVFPPSSLGTSIWYLPEEIMDAIATEVA